MTDSRKYQIEQISCDQVQRRLVIRWKDEHLSHYPYIWLRHHLFFPAMGRPNQQNDQEYAILENPKICSVSNIVIEGDLIKVNWAHDQSTTSHSLEYLRDRCLSERTRRERLHVPLTWLGKDAEKFKWFDVNELDDLDSRFAIFEHLVDYGLVLIRNVPASSGATIDLATYFGAIRNTHFGTLFDIRSMPPDQQGTGENIGATASTAQAPHMDEGWRHGPTGISFFHCIQSASAGGGASMFVDGIGAAEALRDGSPGSFELLTKTPIIFAAERNPQERFRTRSRMIITDHFNIVRGVRISDRNLPEIDLPVAQVESLYEAIADFCRIIYSPYRLFEHLLRPGEMVIFDNHRVLHARRSFDPCSGERWLQHLSVDREEFHNQFRQLAALLKRDEYSNWEPDAGVLSQS